MLKFLNFSWILANVHELWSKVDRILITENFEWFFLGRPPVTWINAARDYVQCGQVLLVLGGWWSLAKVARRAGLARPAGRFGPRGVHCVDLGESFQKRTGPSKCSLQITVFQRKFSEFWEKLWKFHQILLFFNFFWKLSSNFLKNAAFWENPEKNW